MIKIFKICLLLLCISAGCSEKKKNQSVDKPGDEMALFTDMTNLPVRLEQFKGQRVLVNYWATWCVPCLKEFPSLARAQDLLLNENYLFLFPSPDNVEKIKAFNEPRNYPLRFLHLNTSLDKLNIYALPATIIYATDGSEYKRIDGATDWSSPEIIEMLRSVP